MIRLEQASLRGRDNRWRVDEVSLELYPGEVLAVLGPNGAGKSSLLKLMSAELACDKGRVTLDDREMAHLPASVLARCRAVLPQASSLSFGFSVSDVVMMGRSAFRGGGRILDEAIVHEAMRITDVQEHASRDYLSLSGGERQRVHLARVLAQIAGESPEDLSSVQVQGGIQDQSMDLKQRSVCAQASVCVQLPESRQARYLLLDEPTAALDLAHQHQVLGIARSLAHTRRVGVLAIVHDLNLAARYANRVALLRQGRLYGIGLSRDILTRQAIADVFGMPASIIDHPHDPSRILVVTG